MRYLDFLSQVHDLLQPRSYLEIGVRHGHSMALSDSRSIGIDPAYAIAEDIALGANVQLYEQTSDDYFASEEPLAVLDEPVLDLAFIDGLHLYEFVLRDFMNVEKYCASGALVILDDVLPRSSREAERVRETRAWTGDIWKIIPTLRQIRPDLMLLLVGTAPTGLLLVLGADATDHTLAGAYEELLARHVDSGEEPPSELLDRSTAISPATVLAAPFWSVLRDQRERGVPPEQARQELMASLQSWAASSLRTRQARAIHPSLTGRPAKKSGAKPAARKATPPPTGAARVPWEAKRVARGLRRRARKLLGRA